MPKFIYIQKPKWKRSSQICSYCACLQEKYLFINIRNTFTNIFQIPRIQSSVALQYFQFRHAAAECLLFGWYEKLIWYCFCILLTLWNFLHHQIYLINIYYTFYCFLNIFREEYCLAILLWNKSKTCMYLSMA